VLAHSVLNFVREACLAIGTMFVVVGVVQITRTLSAGLAAIEPDSVIVRGGALIGVGTALLYAVFH
jgi:hypothetical protein